MFISSTNLPPLVEGSISFYTRIICHKLFIKKTDYSACSYPAVDMYVINIRWWGDKSRGDLIGAADNRHRPSEIWFPVRCRLEVFETYLRDMQELIFRLYPMSADFNKTIAIAKLTNIRRLCNLKSVRENIPLETDDGSIGTIDIEVQLFESSVLCQRFIDLPAPDINKPKHLEDLSADSTSKQPAILIKELIKQGERLRNRMSLSIGDGVIGTSRGDFLIDNLTYDDRNHSLVDSDDLNNQSWEKVEKTSVSSEDLADDVAAVANKDAGTKVITRGGDLSSAGVSRSSSLSSMERNAKPPAAQSTSLIRPTRPTRSSGRRGQQRGRPAGRASAGRSRCASGNDGRNGHDGRSDCHSRQAASSSFERLSNADGIITVGRSRGKPPKAEMQLSMVSELTTDMQEHLSNVIGLCATVRSVEFLGLCPTTGAAAMPKRARPTNPHLPPTRLPVPTRSLHGASIGLGRSKYYSIVVTATYPVNFLQRTIENGEVAVHYETKVIHLESRNMTHGSAHIDQQFSFSIRQSDLKFWLHAPLVFRVYRLGGLPLKESSTTVGGIGDVSSARGVNRLSKAGSHPGAKASRKRRFLGVCRVVVGELLLTEASAVSRLQLPVQRRTKSRSGNTSTTDGGQASLRLRRSSASNSDDQLSASDGSSGSLPNASSSIILNVTLHKLLQQTPAPTSLPSPIAAQTAKSPSPKTNRLPVANNSYQAKGELEANTGAEATRQQTVVVQREQREQELPVLQSWLLLTDIRLHAKTVSQMGNDTSQSAGPFTAAGKELSDRLTSHAVGHYLLLRAFWFKSDSQPKSPIFSLSCPNFIFETTNALPLSSSLIERLRGNHAVVELQSAKKFFDHVYNDVSENASPLAIGKVPTEHLYWSFCNLQVRQQLLLSEYAPIAFEDYVPLVNLITKEQLATVKVLLAAGLPNQIEALRHIKLNAFAMTKTPTHLAGHTLLQNRHEVQPADCPQQYACKLVVEEVRNLDLQLLSSLVPSVTNADKDSQLFVQFNWPQTSQTRCDWQHTDEVVMSRTSARQVGRVEIDFYDTFDKLHFVVPAQTSTQSAVTRVLGEAGLEFRLFLRQITAISQALCDRCVGVGWLKPQFVAQAVVSCQRGDQLSVCVPLMSYESALHNKVLGQLVLSISCCVEPFAANVQGATQPSKGCRASVQLHVRDISSLAFCCKRISSLRPDVTLDYLMAAQIGTKSAFGRLEKDQSVMVTLDDTVQSVGTAAMEKHIKVEVYAHQRDDATALDQYHLIGRSKVSLQSALVAARRHHGLWLPLMSLLARPQCLAGFFVDVHLRPSHLMPADSAPTSDQFVVFALKLTELQVAELLLDAVRLTRMRDIDALSSSNRSRIYWTISERPLRDSASDQDPIANRVSRLAVLRPLTFDPDVDTMVWCRALWDEEKVWSREGCNLQLFVQFWLTLADNGLLKKYHSEDSSDLLIGESEIDFAAQISQQQNQWQLSNQFPVFHKFADKPLATCSASLSCRLSANVPLGHTNMKSLQQGGVEHPLNSLIPLGIIRFLLVIDQALHLPSGHGYYVTCSTLNVATEPLAGPKPCWRFQRAVEMPIMPLSPPAAASCGVGVGVGVGVGAGGSRADVCSANCDSTLLFRIWQRMDGLAMQHNAATDNTQPLVSDRVIGVCSFDLTLLLSNKWQTVAGWYHIVDLVTGSNKGQIYIGATTCLDVKLPTSVDQLLYFACRDSAAKSIDSCAACVSSAKDSQARASEHTLTGPVNSSEIRTASLQNPPDMNRHSFHSSLAQSMRELNTLCSHLRSLSADTAVAPNRLGADSSGRQLLQEKNVDQAQKAQNDANRPKASHSFSEISPSADMSQLLLPPLVRSSSAMTFPVHSEQLQPATVYVKPDVQHPVFEGTEFNFQDVLRSWTENDLKANVKPNDLVEMPPLNVDAPDYATSDDKKIHTSVVHTSVHSTKSISASALTNQIYEPSLSIALPPCSPSKVNKIGSAITKEITSIDKSNSELESLTQGQPEVFSPIRFGANWSRTLSTSSAASSLHDRTSKWTSTDASTVIEASSEQSRKVTADSAAAPVDQVESLQLDQLFDWKHRSPMVADWLKYANGHQPIQEYSRTGPWSAMGRTGISGEQDDSAFKIETSPSVSIAFSDGVVDADEPTVQQFALTPGALQIRAADFDIEASGAALGNVHGNWAIHQPHSPYAPHSPHSLHSLRSLHSLHSTHSLQPPYPSQSSPVVFPALSGRGRSSESTDSLGSEFDDLVHLLNSPAAPADTITAAHPTHSTHKHHSPSAMAPFAHVALAAMPLPTADINVLGVPDTTVGELTTSKSVRAFILPLSNAASEMQRFEGEASKPNQRASEPQQNVQLPQSDTPVSCTETKLPVNNASTSNIQATKLTTPPNVLPDSERFLKVIHSKLQNSIPDEFNYVTTKRTKPQIPDSWDDREIQRLERIFKSNFTT